MPGVIRVVLAEDLVMLRRALASLMRMEGDIEIVAELSNGAEVVDCAKKCRPDVAVLDIDLPGLDGISAAQALHVAVPECRTLILTGLARPGNLRRAVGANVTGFLSKDIEPEKLIAGIRAVARGERTVDVSLAFAALEREPTILTPRETEIMRLAARGEEAAQIAAQLHLATGTVRNYLTTIVNKLGARNRVDAIRIAREAGWI